jgi:hypothetical protein
MHDAREQEARVQERAIARREVVAIADQAVLGGVADPGEVLQLVGGEQAVGARQRPASRQEGNEHRQRDPGEHHEAAQLDQVEPEPVGHPVHGRPPPRGR